MSRIGKKPIEIPKDVKVNLEGTDLKVEGPKGKLSLKLHPLIDLKIENNVITLINKGKDNFSNAIYGTMGALIRNMITGVTQGFSITLEVFGLGYKAAMKGKTLELSLGYSHPINYTPPDDIKLEVKENKIIVSGIDKQKVGQVAAIIRSFKVPDAYKGKGIRYEGEVLKLKAGKSAGKGKK